MLGLCLALGCGSSAKPPNAPDAGPKPDAATDTPAGPGDASDTALGDVTDGAAVCTPACASGMACVAGACLPTPVTLARAPGCGLAHLALAGANVYWTERATGAVKSLAVANPGGAPTIVAMNQLSPGPITADDAAIYWSNDGDLSIVKAPLAGGTDDGGVAADGGAPAPFLTAPAVVNGLLASGGFVYYGAGPSAFKVASAGGAPTTLASFSTCKPSSPVALALDADHLYQTDFSLLFITRERIDGTQPLTTPCSPVPPATTASPVAVPDTISHSQGELLFDAIAVAGGHVIWADSSNVYAKPVDGTTTTGAPLIAYTAGANAITGFVVSGASIYIGEGDNNGPGGDAIEVAPLDPGDGGENQATVVAAGQPSPTQLVADAAHVYWVTHTPSATAGAADDCAIMSLVK